ncbi:MAG TPA: hypothetical protein VJ571_06035 [Candidatus Nitrosotalea sp.]|nr:hypothetical protein [Candidatus Nitrosotalea sp.]
MAVVTSPKIRVIQELRKEFPQMKIVSGIADVLIAAQKLDAVNEAGQQTKWEFLKNGADEKAFYPAFKKYHLLDKKEKKLIAYFAYGRGGNLYTDREKYAALLRERKGLYAHLIVSSAARTLIANILALPTNNLQLIRESLESGDSQQQINAYSKVVGIMGAKGLYDERYDYYWMGWRNKPHHYWLSKSALMLLSKAR